MPRKIFRFCSFYRAFFLLQFPFILRSPSRSPSICVTDLFSFYDASSSIIHCFQKDLGLASKQCVFVPLSDADPTDTTRRGTHWRLLVYSKPSHSFHLYDSSDGGSKRGRGLSHEDRVLVRQLSGALHSTGRAKECSMVRELCPQQQNGYDCGMYVFCIVELIFRAFMLTHSEPSDADAESHPESAAAKAIQSPTELASRISAELTPQAVSARRSLLYTSAQALREEWLAASASSTTL